MLGVVSIDQMRALEHSAEELGLPGPALMENAGRAIADVITLHYPKASNPTVLVLAGPGNNGGDGLVVARHLHDFGYRVIVYLAARPQKDDAKELLLRQRGIQIVSVPTNSDYREFQLILASSFLVVDAVLGTGRSRPIDEPLGSIFERLTLSGVTVVAVDVPSGVNADTGDADPRAIRATLTVSLGNPKRGLFLGRAAGLVGKLINVDIGIPAQLSQELSARLADSASVRRILPARPTTSHKGSFGRVLVVAGSRLYTGAPILAALGAQRVGAGLVTFACPETIRPALAAHTLETTFLPVPDGGTGEFGPSAVDPIGDRLTEYHAVLIGPGIGRAKPTNDFLMMFLDRLRAMNFPTIIDADALSLLSSWPSWWDHLPSAAILTPHSGEMARLLGRAVGNDRIDCAIQAAHMWKTVVVLKGAYSVIAFPTGLATVLPFANPALSTAGTGDVLGGTILGLIGQGASTDDAAVAGAFLHGLAGEFLAEARGPAGGLASEVADNLPRALRAVNGSTDLSLPFRP